jgi:hypothetical protein
LEEAETVSTRCFGDTGIPVAGPGAPLVLEFSVAEFAAALGLPTETGKRYVGHAVELRYRLPKLWRRVVGGDLAAWKACRVADQTLHLSKEAAAFVDRHVAPVAHKVRPAQVDRLVTEAVARFMPEEAERRRREAWDQRNVTIDYDTVGIAGTCQITGEVDLADAIDLDKALALDAQRQADLGSTETLDQRRSSALGNIARRDLTLDYPANDPTTDPTTDPAGDPAGDPGSDPDSDPGSDPASEPTPGRPQNTKEASPRSKGRELVLNVHLSEAAVRGLATDTVGRVENTRSPVLAETIRAWCGNPDTTIVVKPVRDLSEHVHVEQYEVPDRIAEAVALRDLTCVFPWCSRPARTLKPDEHAADCDHITPHAEGGATCTCQIAALCRRHHRLKTHGGWRYHVLDPGSYIWTSPHGYQYLRDHTGSLDVSRDRHTCKPQQDDQPPGPEPGDP